MFKLRYGYLISGITTGFILLITFFTSLPDGKLHIVYCDVGQGDGAYIRFPDGRDMVVDGGASGTRMISCLGRHMPFWDRTIDIVMGTHPDKDHIGGLPELLRRYKVNAIMRPDIEQSSEIFQEFLSEVSNEHAKIEFGNRGDGVTIGQVKLTVLWPTDEQLASMKPQGNVAGASTIDHTNDASIVFSLAYGDFDAVFTADADQRVEKGYMVSPISVDPIEVLKIPHHGSRTGFSEEYMDWMHPQLAVISVGKNSYGHPHQDILNRLANNNIPVLRTDQEGDIEVISDGKGWEVKN